MFEFLTHDHCHRCQRYEPIREMRKRPLFQEAAVQSGNLWTDVSVMKVYICRVCYIAERLEGEPCQPSMSLS